MGKFALATAAAPPVKIRLRIAAQEESVQKQSPRFYVVVQMHLINARKKLKVAAAKRWEEWRFIYFFVIARSVALMIILLLSSSVDHYNINRISKKQLVLCSGSTICYHSSKNISSCQWYSGVWRSIVCKWISFLVSLYCIFYLSNRAKTICSW